MKKRKTINARPGITVGQLMKTIQTLSLLLLLTLPFAAGAQDGNLVLKIRNEKNEPINGVTVSVLRLPDSSIQTKTVINNTGTISLRTGTAYLVRAGASGYQPADQNLLFQSAQDTMTITLFIKTSNLGNVTIVSRKPLVREEDDKSIIDAEPLANASTNAYEVLEKTPGAIVDQDGNVYLNSSTPATIFLNGREVKLSATDLASLLKSLPANSVQKIEVLRNPSSKYDAASSGGIVNIVLKKGVKLGLNGSVNMAHFQGKKSTSTGGFNLNNNNDKVNSYFSYQFTRRNNFEELFSNRLTGTDGNIIRQSSYTTYPGRNHYAGGGIDYSPTKKWTIGIDSRLSANHNESNANNAIDLVEKISGTTFGKTVSLIGNRGNSLYWGNSVNSKYKIDTSGSEWTISADINYFRGKNRQDYTNNALFPLTDTLAGDGNSDNQKNILILQSDLTWKLPRKITLETGFKFSYSNSRNSALYFLEDGNGNRQTDSFQTNRFRYKEKILSGYIQLARTFGKFTIKPGLRIETTDIEGRQIIPGDTSFGIRRTDIFPFIYLKQPILKLFGFQITGNAIIRRSISRPYYEALNPYPRYIDQFLFDVGNPALRPQFTNNYEFNITADQFPIFSMGVNDIKDIFNNVSYQDTATKIVYRTYDNLGRNKEFYLRFVGGLPPGKKYFFYAGAQHNRNHYTGLYQNQPLDYTRGSWVFFMYHNYRTGPNFNVSLQGFMRLRGLQNFYELGSFGALNLTLNQSVMKKKANIILTFNDIFRTNKVDFAINQPGISASGSRVNDTRRVGLTVRYNFGIKPKEDKKEGFDAPAETNP